MKSIENKSFEEEEEPLFDEVKFEKELKRKKRIKNIIKGTLITGTIVGSYSFGYFVGSFDSTPVKIYKSKIKIGYYQYEGEGYVIKNRKGDEYTLEQRDFEDLTK